MPTWSDDASGAKANEETVLPTELIALHKHCYTDIVNHDELVERAHYVGFVPRNLFILDFQTCKYQLELALFNDFNSILDSVTAGLETSLISSKVWCFTPTQDTFTPDALLYSFVSNHISLKFFEKLESMEEGKAKSFERSIQSVPKFGQVKGGMFERRFHVNVLKNIRPFQVKQVYKTKDAADAEKFNLPPIQGAKVFDNIVSLGADFADYPNTYLRPQNPNFPSLDAIIWKEENNVCIIYGLQISVLQRKHGYIAVHLQKALDAMVSSLKNKASTKQMGIVLNLCLIVPNELFHSRKYQPMLTQDYKILKNEEQYPFLCKADQFVLGYNLV